MRPRRFLPSFSQLSAFEAVLRTGSTTAAARELSLAQSTVSRLVRSLEDQLGRLLFERRDQRLVPTPAAFVYGRDVTRSLDILQNAGTQFASNPEGGTLSLAILPAFGTRWLAPRLNSFLVKNPGITLHLGTRLRQFDFDAEAFDAAIHCGRGDWPDAEHLELFTERVTACVSPKLLAGRCIRSVEDLAQFPLLQIETRPSAWRTWFHAQDAPEAEPNGMLFDQFAPMTQAAIHGLGIALLPEYLAESEISEGRLASILKRAVPSNNSYWLVWPKNCNYSPPLYALRAWLREITQ